MKEKVIRKYSRGLKIGMVIVFVFFLLYAVSLLIPFLWTFLNSLKDWQEYNGDKFSLPKFWLFSNYVAAFVELNVNGTDMFGMFFNSLWYTLFGAFFGVAVSTMVAYVVAKFKFPGRNFIYYLALFTMIIPIVGALPSQYKVYNFLGIYDSPFLILSFCSGFGFNFLVLYSFFRNLSWSYAEAGFIDGAGHFRIFVSVMLPQAIGAASSLFIVALIAQWNDYMGPILFLPSYPTLAAGLYTYQGLSNTDMPKLFAGTLISIVPILVMFVLFQNTLMNLSVAGGIKE